MVEQEVVDIATVGKRLREARNEAGLTQQQLSEKSGLSRPYVANLERGNHRASFNALEQLSGALGVSMSELVREDTQSELPLEQGSTLVDTVVQGETLVDGIRRLMRMPGYEIGTYEGTERGLATRFAELFGMHVDDLYKEGGIILILRDEELGISEEIALEGWEDIFSALEEFRTVDRPLNNVKDLAWSLDEILLPMPYEELHEIAVDLGIDFEKNVYPHRLKIGHLFPHLLKEHVFFDGEEDDLKHEWLRSMVVDTALFGTPVCQISPENLEGIVAEMVGETIHAPGWFDDFDDDVENYRKIRARLIEIVDREQKAIQLDELEF